MYLDWITTLVRSNTTRLAQVACGEGLSGVEALDAVQDGFVNFLRLPQARRLATEPDEAAALLTVVVRNVARNLRRRHHRSRPHVTEESLIASLEDPMPSVDELIAQAEEHVHLLGCMHMLSETQQKVVTLRLLEGATGGDTAARLGISAQHAAVLLHRAKSALRDCIAAAADVS